MLREDQDKGEDQSPKAKSSLIRRVAWGLLFGFIVLLALALVGDLRQVSARVLAFRWGLIPAVLGTSLINNLLHFIKWHFYVGQIGVRGLGWLESLQIFVAGLPLAVTPGKAGEVLKGVWVRQASGVSAARGVAVVIAERVSDGIAVLFLSTLGVVAYPKYWPAFAIILTGLTVFILISQIRPLAMWLLGLGERLPIVKRFAHMLREFYEGSYALYRPKAALVGVGLGGIAWVVQGVGMYLVLLGLGVAPGWETFSVAVFALSFSIAVGGVSTLPGGLGASEATIAVILALALGLQTDVAAAATALIRFATLWFGVSLGLVVWAFSPHLLGLADQESVQIAES